MTLNPELIPIKKDAETIRKDVLTNIIKMLSARGYINEKNVRKNIDNMEKPRDDDTYQINLDKNISPESSDKNYIKQFVGNVVMVRIVHIDVKGLTKLPVIKDFLLNYKMNHKILVFDGISDKAKATLNSTPNTECFIESFFMLNILEYIDSPKYEILSTDEANQVIDSYLMKKNEMMKILTIDPIVSYFNLRRGDVLRIIRPSSQSGNNIAYRIVAKAGTG